MFLRPTGSQWRTPEVGKSYVVSSYRGITRVSAWPRPRGRAKTELDRSRQLLFKLVQMLIKRLHWREVEYERRMVANHNRTHTGQRGSAAIRLRDWQTQRFYGRGLMVIAEDLATFYPAAIARDASLILDHTTDEPGHLLQRNPNQWGSIPAGLPGQVLTAGSAGQPNTWQTIA